MADPFDDPVSATPIPYSELHGALLLFRVLSYEEHIPTSYTEPGKRSPAVRANVTVIDGPHAGHEYPEVLVFPKMLQAQLRPRVGRMVLGRLGQGEAKKGQNAPWELTAASADDKAKVAALLTGDPGPSSGVGSGTQPSAAAAPGSSLSGEPPF